VTVPPLDDDARRRALLGAAEARRIRADWKSRLSRGEDDLGSLLAAADVDPAVGKMKVVEALGALPGVGPRGVLRILESCGIAQNRRLRGLGPRQRAALLDGAWRRGQRQ
jgi:hypothetical protein